MGDFLGSLFGGQNKTLNSNINNMGSLANFSSNIGTGDTTAASDFWKGIMSGDPTKIATVLAPQIRTMQNQAQQQKNTMGQFGQRSGGTTSAANAIDSNTRGNIDQLIGQLTGQGAQQLGQLGTTNLELGQQGNMTQAELSQQRMKNFMNSILGTALSGGVNYLESFLPVAHSGS
jgi:hypothetical protein